ncbi:MAG TPA: hypothetical protein H9845_06655 [Candidatus Agathobaculum pullicola]|nr:hypothetical protein [Candidatus Agathobaculum pullicola]
MILDFLLSLMADGAVAGAQSRHIPKMLRIVLAVLIVLFMLLVGGFMLLCAVAIDGEIEMRLVCGGLAILCLGYLVFFIRGVWRTMR